MKHLTKCISIHITCERFTFNLIFRCFNSYPSEKRASQVKYVHEIPITYDNYWLDIYSYKGYLKINARFEFDVSCEVKC